MSDKIDKPDNTATLNKKPLEGRRFIPESPKVSVVANNTDDLLNDAKMIIAAELAKYRTKAVKGVTLDLKEARVVQGYLESLTKLQREEREQARASDLSNLSNEELLQLAQTVLGDLKPKLIEGD